MGHRSYTGMPLASLLIILLSGTSFASAEESALEPPPSAILILLLPLVGAILLLLVALPPLLGRPYRRETPAFHVANTVTTTSLVTLLMAILLFYVVYEASGSSPYSLAVIAVVGTVILTGVLMRYLLVPLPLATMTGGAFACILVLLAFLALDASHEDLWTTVEGLLFILPLLLIIWSLMLAWVTVRFHHVEDVTDKGTEGPRLPRRRMLRLGELLIANMAVGAGLLLILVS